MQTNNNPQEAVFRDVESENNAQEVFKKLTDIDNARDRLVSRWVWELLQNARGTAGSQNSLQIEVVLDGELLLFRHNGSTFKDREIAHLILHGSSKHAPGDIGKFGSGFITTHLISRQVRVRGSLSDGRCFDFVLNRAGKDAAELRQAMDNSKAEYFKSLANIPSSVPSPYTTEYSYPLSDSIRKVVLQGIQSLRQSAAYIFAFNPMLQGLKISALGESVAFTQMPLEPILPNTRCMALCESGKQTTQRLVTFYQENVEAAISIESAGESFRVQLPSDIPRLFVAFPLNNTDNFGIPLVLNSESFFPPESRDGIYLGISDNETNTHNKELFTVGCRNIIHLIALAADKDWLNTASATHIPAFATPSWANDIWLRSQIRDVLIAGFRSGQLLRTVSGQTIAPQSAWIPVTQNASSSSELWRVTEKLSVAADSLPRSLDQKAWGQSLQSWLPFLKDKEPQPKEIWSVEKLALHVESLKTVAAVSAALQKDTVAISWINEVHALIVQAGCFELFRQRALIPNEKGNFVQLGTLHLHSTINEALKDIAEQLGFPIRSNLIHTGIDSKEILGALSIYSEATLVSKVLDLVRTRFLETPLPDDVRKANVSLFGWLLTSGQTVHLDNYPVLSQVDLTKKVASHLQLRANSSDNQRWLAPVPLWPAQAKAFSDLFADSVILHPDYANACGSPELWHELETKGYIQLGPLFEAASQVSDFLPDEPLPADEERTKPNSETPQLRSEIPFFSGDDHFVLNRARGSETRAIKVLKFLFDFILPADPKAFDEVTTKCDNGKEHRFFRAGWLTSLRNRWVPVGQGRLAPSAESMAGLLGNEPDLLKRLSDQRISQLFCIMGASPADLMLRSVGQTDQERMSLIQSLALITKAVGHDAERVKALAGAIEQDPQVLVFADQRRERRETVKRNQELGALVEALFKQAFQGTGLIAYRTGPGHDYLVTEGEEEDVGRIEIDSPIGKVFVEIKATTTNVARMSVKQVQEAVNNKDHYFLCVLAVADANVDVEAFNLKSRFVTNIGGLFQTLWEKYVSMKSALDLTPKYESGLAIELTDQQAKFRVDKEVWQAGLAFNEVIAEFRSRLAPQA